MDRDKRAARLRAVSACAMLVLLMGCSDDGGFIDRRPDFDELSEQGDRLADEIEDLDPATTEDLPTTGVASYEGVLVVETEDDQTLAGEMDMAVDFADARDPLSGEVTNIVDADEARYDGTLSISESRLDREGVPASGPIFSADLNGTLEDPDGVELEVAADMEGSFGGSGNDAISHAGGFVEGDSCSADACQGFDGAFVLER